MQGVCGRDEAAADLDSRVVNLSPLYYLGGRVEARQEVDDRNDPAEKTLRWNMRHQDIARIIINDNSFRFVGPFNDGDVLLDVKLPALTA